MDKTGNKTSIIIGIILSLALVGVIVCSITLAYFYSANKAGVTLQFHDPVTINVTGVTNTGGTYNDGLVLAAGTNAGKWQHKADGGAWAADNATANKSLAFSGLRANATSAVKVRVFVAVKVTYTGATKPAVPAVTFAGGTSTTEYTSKETAFISANLTGDNISETHACNIFELTTSYFTLLNDYTVFDFAGNQHFAGATVNAMVMISASTDGTNWDNASGTYSFSY